MLGGLTLVGILAGRKNTSTRFLLARHLKDRINFRIYHNKPLSGNYFDLGSSPLPAAFSLQFGQEVTLLFVGQGKKMFIFFVHLILHVCRKIALCCDADFIFSEIVILDSPIGLFIHVYLIISGRQVLSQFMYLKDAIYALDYDNPKGFHNFILNAFHVIFECGTMLAPHVLYQL